MKNKQPSEINVHPQKSHLAHSAVLNRSLKWMSKTSIISAGLSKKETWNWKSKTELIKLLILIWELGPFSPIFTAWHASLMNTNFVLRWNKKIEQKTPKE